MPADRAALEAERAFLLRSLDDLDAERAAGNVDDGTYETLHADYTARAAAVIRALESGAAPRLPSAPSRPRWAGAAVAAGVVAFALASAFFLARAVGTREPGATATGNDEVAGDRIATLRAAAEARPDDYSARIALARALVASDRVAALQEYDAAAALDPTQPEPVAYGGWIIGLAARGAPAADRDLLVSRALARLDAAVRLDPEYPDAYVFRALVRTDAGDAAAAVPDFQHFLRLAPSDHPLRATVQDALARALELSQTPTTGGP
jgi:cytochrome c-type biogenesis protein CcmH/NrfG